MIVSSVPVTAYSMVVAHAEVVSYLVSHHVGGCETCNTEENERENNKKFNNFLTVKWLKGRYNQIMKNIKFQVFFSHIIRFVL